MRILPRISVALARLAFLAALSYSGGCSSDGTPSNRVIQVTPVARVSVTPTSATLDVGGSVQLAALTLDVAGNTLQGRSITWSSTSNAIASVTSAGMVVAVAPGAATISASSEGQQGSASITVLTPVPAAVARVAVTPATASVSVGGATQLSAVATDAAGNTLQGRPITWSTSSTIVASVTTSGMVAGIAAGTATISATAEGQTGTSTITVVPLSSAAVARVSITPANASVDVGSTTQLGAIVYDSAGAELQGRTIAWSTSASAIASVTANGTVTGVAAGAATISAIVEGKQGSASVTVNPPASSVGTITVNGSQQFQTMAGWEALAEIGQAECDPRAYQTYKSGVLDRAANELGINRIRLGLRNGYENPVDQFTPFKAGQLTFNQWKVYWFQVVNDNGDPFVMNPAGFNWGYLDYTMDELIVPLKQRLAARGEGFWLNLSYTGANTGDLHRDSPDEYAEFVLAAFQHIQQKYGWAPNSLELVNEPDLGTWLAPSIGRNLLAAKQRLNQAGFFPDFVGPSASKIGDSIQFFDQMMLIPGVPQALNEFAYHRYSTTPTQSQLRNVAQRGTQYGMRTAMLEHGGSGYADLHEDLTVANVSAWQQFGLAFCSDRDIGGTYFPIYGAALGNNSPNVLTGSMTKYLRQYFRYVALRAVRVGATTADARFAPVAFRNVNGKYVVVVNASAAGSFSVGGLPAGTYGIDYTTANAYMQALPNVTITGAQALTTSIPATGVLTIFAR